MNSNLIITGDSGVGKTTFIKRLITGEFEKSYHPTIGVEKQCLSFFTNYGQVTFNINDIAGQEKFRDYTKEYTEANCAIVIFDLSSKISFKIAVELYRKIAGKIPTVLCDNKCDITPFKVSPEKIDDFMEAYRNNMIYHTSAKSCYQFDKPFLTLLREITGNKDLNFIAAPAINPPIKTKKNFILFSFNLFQIT